jgi:hypothetical protein
MKSMRMLGWLLVAVVALATTLPTALAARAVEQRIVLRPAGAFPAAKGSAKFKSKGGERELQVEVEHIRRLAGKRVVFLVAGVKLGSKKVNGLGAAEINRNSDLGQRVPNVRPGTSVKVKTAGGVLIVKGSF